MHRNTLLGGGVLGHQLRVRPDGEQLQDNEPMGGRSGGANDKVQPKLSSTD